MKLKYLFISCCLFSTTYASTFDNLLSLVPAGAISVDTFPDREQVAFINLDYLTIVSFMEALRESNIRYTRNWLNNRIRLYFTHPNYGHFALIQVQNND